MHDLDEKRSKLNPKLTNVSSLDIPQNKKDVDASIFPLESCK
jgi:hypothetical protein